MDDLAELDELNYDELDKQLQEEIGTQLKELEDIKADRKSIGNPKKLTESISQIVWEQFILQIGGQAGSDFIKQNHDLNLSLSKADHILNEDSFAQGKMPMHNFENRDNYQQRYDTWNSKFTDSTHEHLTKDFRAPYDVNRVKGNSQYAMDHTISVKEIVLDKKAAAFMSQDEKVAFANDTNINLKPLDRAANASKGYKRMMDWLNSIRIDKAHPNGAKPDERFNINREELEKRDQVARAEFDKDKNNAEQRTINEGKASIRAEALKSASFTAQAVAVALLAKLTRTIS